MAQRIDVQEARRKVRAHDTTVRSLAMATAAVIALVAIAPLVGVPDSRAGAAERDIASFEREVVEHVNEIRQEQGVQPLEVDEDLAAVARAHSCRMARDGVLAHEAPGTGGIADRLRAAGKPFSVAGENLAHNLNVPDPVATAVRGWMQSEGHRENVLRDAFTRTGVGICRRERGYYFTQIFVRPPKLDRFGRLIPHLATPAERRGEEVFFGKGRCAECHVPPFYLDDKMHNLRLERFYAAETIHDQHNIADGPIKTFTLRGIQDSPPHHHDGWLLTLEDTVESSTWRCRHG